MKKSILIGLLAIFLVNIQSFAEGVDWNVNIYDFQYDMTAYVDLRVKNEEVSDLSSYTVAAFYNDECRGITDIREVNGVEYGYLRIRSNTPQGEEISFKVFNHKTLDVATATNTITFKAMDVVGYPSSPLVLDVMFIPKKEEFVTICAGESYTWNGNIYSVSDTYEVEKEDTLEILHLTVLPDVPITNEQATICYGESYTWQGQAYAEGGVYSVTLQDKNGCDSIVTLHLTINQTQYADETVVACDSYTWNGQTYTASGDYVYTTTASNGCDSIVTLHLTINKSEYVEETATACDSYEWNGVVYTESGDYTYNATTEQGCERVEVLHLTIKKSEYVEESVTACDSYEWNGIVYTESGDYIYTTTTDQGCERVEVLHLTILPDATTESETLALCPSELPYEWYGQMLTEAGSYTATEQYAGMECDSVIHELTLNVYVQTLPASVTLPIIREGEAIDVAIPTAEIQAHIAAETWYAPNAEVAWYIMENSDWAALTAEPVKAGTTQVVLKYAVATDCGSVESDNIVIDVIPTSVENTHSQSPTSDCQKILYEDHIYILREGKMYNAQGQKVQ